MPATLEQTAVLPAEGGAGTDGGRRPEAADGREAPGGSKAGSISQSPDSDIQRKGGVDGDPERILNLRRQLALQRSINAAIKADGHRFYRPHPKQDAFHRAGKFKRRAAFAGNRFGKSQLGAAEDAAWLRGERVWYPEYDPARTAGIPRHPVKGLVIVQDWDKCDEIWTSQRGDRQGKIWKYLPSSFVKSTNRNHSGCIDTIECANGSVLRFDTVKSWMSNPMGAESSDWDFVHVDEPCPEGMFKGVARGLIDRYGSAWFTLTALSEPWIVDMFHENGFNTPLRDGFWSVTGTIYDNPHLPREAIAEFERTLTEDEKQCRLFGIPLHLAGLVYKSFRYDRHVLVDPPVGWNSVEDPPESYTIHIRIDPHPQVPHAVLFCAVSPLGYRFYFRDIFMHGTVEEIAREIRAITAHRNVGSIKIDPIAFNEDQNNPGTTWAAQFIRAGVPVDKARKDLDAGIVKVNQELQRTNPQVIWFTQSCRRTLWEIQRYCWDPRGLNKPVDRDDHMMENLYRMELDNPWWTDQRNYNIPIEDIVVDSTDTDPIEIGL